MGFSKKLIEVSLPLMEINKEASREKYLHDGHPSTLHTWWARRPLAACRAVLFASLVDDPGEYLPENEARLERERLFRVIGDLVKWENSNVEEVLAKAREAIACSMARNLGVKAPVGDAAIREFLAHDVPPILDPFCGGGSIPLEVQRLGLKARGGDLNPVAVLITKALIEIPSLFPGQFPVHPREQLTNQSKVWSGAEGLADDVRWYAKWLKEAAQKRIGHLYPKVTVNADTLARDVQLSTEGIKNEDEFTVVAWIWVHTVTCPNPACQVEMPLARSFWLSKNRKDKAWIEPVADQVLRQVHYNVCVGVGQPPDGTVNRHGARCIACKTNVPFEHIRAEGRSKRLRARLMAVVAEKGSRKVYISPTLAQETAANCAEPPDVPDTDLPNEALGFRVQRYGLTKHRHLFRPRQLYALSTFSDLISQVHEHIERDSVKAGIPNDGIPLSKGGTGACAYADAVVTYLAFAISKIAARNSILSTWNHGSGALRAAFSRQTVSMVWDYCETNPFLGMGNYLSGIEQVAKLLESLPLSQPGMAYQHDAAEGNGWGSIIVSTDPPYYDNIGYADLSDFFYIWLRKSLGAIWPALFETILTPKSQEIVANPARFDGDKMKARQFFEERLFLCFSKINQSQHLQFPLSIFYAFKQAETEGSEDEDGDDDDVSYNTKAGNSSGWETILESLIHAGLMITGAWPVRTEMAGRLRAIDSNALATSIILVCRPRPAGALSTTLREFLSVLKRELPPALHQLQQGSIAPVDLAQAAIGPGIAVFSRYAAVLEADGAPIRVRDALTLINQTLDEFLTEQESEYDSNTRWALAWHEQFGNAEAAYGVAETLSKAKNTSIHGLVAAGIIEARAGKVRLLKRDELATDWDPETDKRLTQWESVLHLIHALETDGEAAAAALLSHLGAIAEPTRDLAYRLYTVCERKGWAQDALGYNMLVAAWPRLRDLAARKAPGQANLL
jgi:putative DNA methylase